jgi:hypothetical protein
VMLRSPALDALHTFAGTCIQIILGVICCYTGKEDGPAYENRK